MERRQTTPTIELQRRTKNLLTRLRQSPQLLKIYDDIIVDQERCGFIEKVNDIPSFSTISSLPIPSSYQEGTPIRIVYDCSCRESSA